MNSRACGIFERAQHFMSEYFLVPALLILRYLYNIKTNLKSLTIGLALIFLAVSMCLPSTSNAMLVDVAASVSTATLTRNTGTGTAYLALTLDRTAYHQPAYVDAICIKLDIPSGVTLTATSIRGYGDCNWTNSSYLPNGVVYYEDDLFEGFLWEDPTVLDLTFTVADMSIVKDYPINVKVNGESSISWNYVADEAALHVENNGYIKVVNPQLPKPSAPTIYAVDEATPGEGGKLTGLDDTMEYRNVNSENYTPVPNQAVEVSGLPAGSYVARIMEIPDVSLASDDSAVVTINACSYDAVSDFTVVAGEEQITVSWSRAAQAQVTKYVLYRSTSEDGTYTAIQTINGRDNTYYIDKAVTSATTYYYKLMASDAANTPGNFTEILSAVPLPDVTSPQIMYINPEQGTRINANRDITVSASDNMAVASIELQYSTDNGETFNTYQTQNGVWAATFSFNTTVIQDGAIQIRAIATDSAGNVSDGLPVHTYIIDNTGPNVVSGLDVLDAKYTTVTLKWDEILDEDYAYCVVEEKRGEAWVKIATVITDLGVNITGLLPETTYYYRVIAYDNLGNRGIESEPLPVTTIADTEQPVITSILPKPNRYSLTIPLVITARDTDKVQSIEIQTSANLENWASEIIYTLNSPASSYTYSYSLDLASKDEGFLYVRAVAKDASGNYSDSSSSAPFVQYVVDRTAPAAPENFVSEGHGGYIELKWSMGSESDLNGYNVFRSTSEFGTYSKIASAINKINYIDTNVELATAYYYKIQALDLAGNVSEFSNVVSGQMLDDITKPVINSWNYNDGVIRKSTGFSILATDNNKLASLTLWYRQDGAEWQLLTIKETTNSNATFTFDLSVLNDGLYEFQAQATDASGNVSEYSYRTYTLDSMPPEILNVSVTPQENSIALEWEGQKESDLAGYYIYRRTTGHYTQVASFSAAAQNLSYTDSNVQYGTNYIYRIEAWDIVGNTRTFETQPTSPLYVYIPPVPDTTPPNIVCLIKSVIEQDVQEWFDATGSNDNVGIVGYLWDFGDGNTLSSKEPKVYYAYSEVGAYTVTLTIFDAAGNQSVATQQVQVTERTSVGKLKIKVVDDNGNNVPGIGVYYRLATENQVVYATNPAGEITISDRAGTYDIGIYGDGYLPVKRSVTIISNVESDIIIRVIKKDIIVGELTYTRMTFEEIIAAGIDPYAPENQHVYKYEIELTYGTTVYKGSVPAVSSNSGTSQTIKIPDWMQTQNSSQDASVKSQAYIIVNDDYKTTDYNIPQTSKNKALVAVIEMPGEASWLKEFFDVQLYLHNQADEEFVIDNCIATLQFPESGLNLQTGLVGKYSEAKTVNIGSIAGGEHKYINWVLSGEKEGEYEISADFSGTLREFNEVISAQFKCAEPIKVYGSSNLFLEILVENTIETDSDTATRIGLCNDGVVDVYLPNISMEGLEYIRTFKSKDGITVKDSFDILRPGEKLYVDYRIPRELNATLESNKDKEFYLHQAVLNSIGGNINLTHYFKVVPAYTISPDVIEVYTRNENDELIPLNMIDIKKDRFTMEIPSIVIKTFSLDENMEFVPASREILIKDQHLIDEGDVEPQGLTVTTDDAGTYILNGYELFSLKTAKSYSITISSKRAVKRVIPVAIRADVASTGVVYGEVNTKTLRTVSPVQGATVTIGEHSTTTDENGKFTIKDVHTGANDIKIEKEGFNTWSGLINVSSSTKPSPYNITKQSAENEPYISYITSVTSGNNYGSNIIIPEGMIKGSIQFVIQKDVRDNTFEKYIYYIFDKNNNVKDSHDFTTDIFTINVDSLAEGDQVYIKLVTKTVAGDLVESNLVDTNIITVNTPSFLEDIVLLTTSFGTVGKTENFSLLDKNLLGELTTETTSLKEQSLFSSEWVSADDENIVTASEMVTGFRLDSKTKTTFPLKASYNIDGTLKISFAVNTKLLEGTSAYYQSSGDYFAYSNPDFSYEEFNGESYMEVFQLKNLDSKDSPLSIGGAAILDFTLKYDPKFYDWKGTLDLTLNGAIKAKVFKGQLPVGAGVAGGYFNVNAAANSTVQLTLFEHYLRDGFALELPPEIVSALNAGIELKAGLGVYALDSDILSAGVYAKLNGTVELMPQQKLEVGYELGAEGKVLVWSPSKEILSDTMEIRPFDNRISDTQQFMTTLMSLPESELDIDYEPAVADWIGAYDGILKQGAFSGSKTQLILLGNDDLMLVFADYANEYDANNPVAIKYSVYKNGEWSSPKMVDSNGTVDLFPYLSRHGDSAVITWMDFSQPIENADKITMNTMKEDVFSKMAISVSMYDINTDSWSTVNDITQSSVFKKSPRVVANNNQQMVIWVENGDNEMYGTVDSQDSICYTLLTDGIETDTGEIDSIAGYKIVSVDVAEYNEQYYLAYIVEDNNATKAYLKLYSNGQWGKAERLNENMYADSLVRFSTVDNGLFLYYVNDNKVYRKNLLSDERQLCIVENSDLSGTIAELEVSSYDSIEYLVWKTNELAMENVYLSMSDEDGKFGKGIGINGLVDNAIISNIDLAFMPADNNVVVTYINTVFDGESAEKILSNIENVSIPIEQNLVVVENSIASNSKLIPGVKIPVSFTVQNNGLVSSKGFSVFTSFTDNESGLFGESHVYSGEVVSGDVATVIMDIELPENYNGQNVYIIVKDSQSNKISSIQYNNVYDDVAIVNAELRSNSLDETILNINVVNDGYVDRSNLLLEVLSAHTDEVVTTYNIELLEKNAESSVVLSFATPELEESQIYKIRLAQGFNEVNVENNSCLLEINESDFGILHGDYTGDGKILPNDVTAMLRFIAFSEQATERNIFAGDINMNGLIEPNDATAILQYCAGLIENF